jgi:hypothetical protein
MIRAQLASPIYEYVAQELLRAEGLTDVRYVEEQSGDSSLWIARS